MFNGSKGRLGVVESTFRIPLNAQTPSGTVHGAEELADAGGAKITLHHLWQPPKNIPIPSTYNHAGHGGGDMRMLSVLFGAQPGEEVDQGDAAKQKAGVRDGTMVLAVGLAANESFKTHQFVKIADLNLEG